MFSSKHKTYIANNSGSAIISVIVSMLFVMALGAALLFTTYTGYSIEITQRGDKTNFYDASSAMDDIRLGIQTLLSEAVAESYTQVLTNYVGTHADGYDAQVDFNDKIIAELLKKTVTVSGSPVDVFTSGTDHGKTVITGYNTIALKAFIDASEQGYVWVTGPGGTERSYSEDDVLSSVSLKTVNVQYVRSGYESNITTDIMITMPYFFASSSVTSGINNYAIIANNSLIHQLGSGTGIPDVTITGSVFAGTGGIALSGNSYELHFLQGDLISKGTISVDESAIFDFNATGNQLWANGIEVGNSANVTLDGSVYVANDLILGYITNDSFPNDHASATLKNTYFGFGNSSDNSESSSAILVNGRECTLKIDELSKLTLAGISFIKTSSQDLFDSGDALYSSAIPMGQSLSVKSDQLAYLVPLKCITNYATNPCVFSNTVSTTDVQPKIDLTSILWGEGDDAKTLTDYLGTHISGNTYSQGQIKTLYKNIDDKKVAYVFLVFNEKEYANNYFRDFFAADPGKIEQYLSLYLSLSDKADNAKINTAGNIFNMENNDPGTAEDNVLTLQPASENVYAEGAQLLYNRMQSPYLVFVNTLELSKIGTSTLEFKDSSNNVVAIVSGADSYTYSGSPSTVRLIISSNSVSISGELNGIVIARENVIVNNNVTGELLTSDILSSTCTVGSTSYTLSDFINNSAQISGSSNASEDLWNLDTLVSYKKWTKH